MFTLFDLIAAIACVVGGVLGLRFGHALGGRIGTCIGGVLGAYAGLLLGRVPGVLASRSLLRELRRASTPELRQRLEGEYYLSHLIIAVLLNRGEPVESFRDVVLRQLSSESPDVVRFGQTNARLWFPDLADPKAGG